MADRIDPTPEDLAIVACNLKRLMRWCKEAGVPVRDPRAFTVAQNFVKDMAEFRQK